MCARLQQRKKRKRPVKETADAGPSSAVANVVDAGPDSSPAVSSKLPSVADLLSANKTPDFLADKLGVKRDAVKYYNIEEPAASTHKRSRSSVPDAAGDGATEVKAPVKKPETMEEKLQAKQDLLRHRLEKDPKAFSRFKPNEASVALKQMTVKEKEHEKRLKGQSTHARYISCICDWVRSCLNTSCGHRWKTEEEMQQRQQFD